jgi:hypothetical protein|tara:strand:- start:205 stop:723 length:519 start_codon:yes stop_codon:yes gene_type:complete
MQTLVIQTQYRENYACHDEGYVHGTSESYWKFKGGSTYFVDDLTQAQIDKIVDGGIPTLSALIEYSNEASEEYVIDWEIRDLGKNGDGKGPICEPWETPVQFYWKMDRWLCRTHHTPTPEYSHWATGIVGRAEQWIPGEGNSRNDYKCQYKTANGWFDQKDAQLKTELEASH